MLLMFFWSCTTQNLDRSSQTEHSDFAKSASLPTEEQMLMLQNITKNNPEKLEDFCAYEHSKSVEEQCAKRLMRPHLLDSSLTKNQHPLHRIPKEETQLQQNAILKEVKQAMSARRVAALCNNIDEEKLHSECYFAAADARINQGSLQSVLGTSYHASTQ